MSGKVSDVLWEMHADAGVKRYYGIVGDALNPVIDALWRKGKIEFIHLRHGEDGVFAAVAEAYLTGHPVVVCGTAGPSFVHLFIRLMGAPKAGFLGDWMVIGSCGRICRKSSGRIQTQGALIAYLIAMWVQARRVMERTISLGASKPLFAIP